jgi:DNA-binding NtrC family response regulator
LLPAPSADSPEGTPIIEHDPSAFRPIEDEVRELEKARMAAALKAASGHQRKAAALISMPLRTFVAKLKLYRLTTPRDRRDEAE